MTYAGTLGEATIENGFAAHLYRLKEVAGDTVTLEAKETLRAGEPVLVLERCWVDSHAAYHVVTRIGVGWVLEKAVRLVL
jgi:hypothetical protein